MIDTPMSDAALKVLGVIVDLPESTEVVIKTRGPTIAHPSEDGEPTSTPIIGIWELVIIKRREGIDILYRPNPMAVSLWPGRTFSTVGAPYGDGRFIG